MGLIGVGDGQYAGCRNGGHLLLADNCFCIYF